MTTTRTAYVDSGDLYDYRTGDYLRPATEDEERRSMEAAETDGGAGAVEIVDPAKVRPEDVRVGDWADDRYPEPYRAAYVGECVLTDPDQAGMTDEDLRAEAVAELRRAGALDESDDEPVPEWYGAERRTLLLPFTEDDWYGWAGAERFADGREPLIGEVGKAVLIADATGIMLSWSDEDGECYQAEVKPLVMEGRAGEPGPDAGTIRAWAESVFAALVGGAW